MGKHVADIHKETQLQGGHEASQGHTVVDTASVSEP